MRSPAVPPPHGPGNHRGASDAENRAHRHEDQKHRLRQGHSRHLQIVVGLADEKRIRQVISNLLENAVRHTPDNGTIEIVVSKIDEKNAKVSVVDSGDGIEPEQAPNLFTSFIQVGAKERVGRLGLGLSIAKDIVINHDGRIWAQSDGLGKGASFNFTLPIANS